MNVGACFGSSGRVVKEKFQGTFTHFLIIGYLKALYRGLLNSFKNPHYRKQESFVCRYR